MATGRLSFVRRALVMPFAGAAVAGAIVVAAACSGEAATGPTAALNARLIARFDSLTSTSQVLHADQLRAVATLLAGGTPVGHGVVTLDGASSTFSMIAQYNVNDTAGVPADSVLTLFAWSGEDADTIVEVDREDLDMGILVTDSDSLHVNVVMAPSAVTTSTPGRRCSKPPGISTPPDSSCRIETVMMAVNAVLSDSPLPDVDLLLPEQPITAIRQHFNDPTP
jgi:hypothetical protein